MDFQTRVNDLCMLNTNFNNISVIISWQSFTEGLNSSISTH